LNKLLSDQFAVDNEEAGFSVLKLLLWLAVAGFVLLNGALIGSAYYNNSKVQECFESLSSKMPEANESEIRAKMDALFRMQYIAADDLPDAFYAALQINATGNGVEISSLYQITIWPFGAVEAVDEFGEYGLDDLQGLDILKHKARLDLSFEPYAISPMVRQ